ncbi:MAG: Tol-Pal system protein TolB [Hahellaceae bacterium]|nr:Tol-Pal system protein TolB [Hahellaceae bacterium]
MAGLVLTGLCRAELTIEISEGVDNPIPVAVVPFANRSVAPLPDDVRQIISDDLQRSGEFTSLDISRMLSLPSRGDEVRYRDWSLVGQSYLVIGDIEYSQIENVYSIRYELYDVFQEKFVVGQKYVVTADRLREVSHKISDRIYETITGVKGIFSTKIAYVTLNRDAKGKDDYRLYVADADGRHARMLLQTTEPVLSVAWSPNGQKLAYVSFETGRPAIYIQEVESGNRKTVSAYTGLNSAPAWSPDGKYLAMTLSKDGNAEIYKLNLETGQLQRLTNHYAIDTEPSWSPDGKSIVFTSDRSGGPQIYWMGVDGERQERLTFDGKYNARARYTGDNRQIIYVHQSDGAFNIASLDLSSNTQLILTQTPLDESPSMAPNGRMLIYATQRGRNGVLAVVSLDGKAKYFLPSSQGDVREPSWSPYVN